MRLSELKKTVTKEWLEVKYFQEGKSQSDIAVILQCRKNRVSELFTYFGIKSDNRYRAIYKTRHSFFSEWSSDMAYILGFITCDGYIQKTCLSFDLNKKDVVILEYIMSKLCPDGRISFRNRIDKRTGNTYEQVHCHVISSTIISDLRDFGITIKKTGNEKVIEVPEKYIYDYLRGIIDGDGCIRLKQVNDRNCAPVVQISSASHTFLTELNETYLDKKGKVRKQGHGCYALTLEKRSDIISFLSKIYNGNFCLPRKYQKFLEILEYDKLMSTNKISQGTIKGLQNKASKN